MAYCRWSTDHFRCDLYAYESVANCFVIHVAAVKHDAELPLDLPPLPEYPSEDLLKDDQLEQFTVWFEERRRRDKIILAGPRVPIGLPHDGKTFEEPTLADMKARMMELKKVGYRVPEVIFERIDAELQQENNEC